MAKVRGPLFSSDAAGGFGRSLLFRGGPGGSRVSRHPALSRKPHGGPTAAQEAQRAAYAAAVEAWRALSLEDRAEWAAQAAATGRLVTGYNLFLAAHMRGELTPPDLGYIPPGEFAVVVEGDVLGVEGPLPCVTPNGMIWWQAAYWYKHYTQATRVLAWIVPEPGDADFRWFLLTAPSGWVPADGITGLQSKSWYGYVDMQGDRQTIIVMGRKLGCGWVSSQEMALVTRWDETPLG